MQFILQAVGDAVILFREQRRYEEADAADIEDSALVVDGLRQGLAGFFCRHFDFRADRDERQIIVDGNGIGQGLAIGHDGNGQTAINGRSHVIGMAFEDRRHGQHIFTGHLTAGQGIADEDAADEGCRTAAQAAGRRDGIDQAQRASFGQRLAVLDGHGLHGLADHVVIEVARQGIGSQAFDFNGNRVFIRFFRKINVIVQSQRNPDGIKAGADVGRRGRDLCVQRFCHFLHLDYTNGIRNLANAR